MEYYNNDAQLIAKNVLVNLCKNEEFVNKIKAKLVQNISNNKNLDDNAKAYQIKMVNQDKFLKTIMQKVVERCQGGDFTEQLIEYVICSVNDLFDSQDEELKLL